MPATLNKVLLMGNLTREPELRRTQGGEAVCAFGLAVSEQFRSRTTGERREEVTFLDVTVWGKTAENCGQYLTKGRPVFVEGRLVMEAWEDKATGQKRSRLKVRADRVQFLPSSRDRLEGRPGDGEAEASRAMPGQPAGHGQPGAGRAVRQAGTAYPPPPPQTAHEPDDDLPF